MTATEYHWPDTRDRAITAFNGDTPGDTIEAAVQHHFKEHPGRVHNLIDAIGRRVATGNVRSGWAILNHELEKTTSDVVATDNRERQQHLKNAEHWIHNTGGYIDRESELIDCLFGPTGPLKAWPELQPQLVEAWHRERPRFTKAEEEAEMLARTRVEHRAATTTRLRKATTHSAGATEADAHTSRIAHEIERARLAWADTIAPDPDEAE